MQLENINLDENNYISNTGNIDHEEIVIKLLGNLNKENKRVLPVSIDAKVLNNLHKYFTYDPNEINVASNDDLINLKNNVHNRSYELLENLFEEYITLLIILKTGTEFFYKEELLSRKEMIEGADFEKLSTDKPLVCYSYLKMKIDVCIFFKNLHLILDPSLCNAINKMKDLEHKNLRVNFISKFDCENMSKSLVITK